MQMTKISREVRCTCFVPRGAEFIGMAVDPIWASDHVFLLDVLEALRAIHRRICSLEPVAGKATICTADLCPSFNDGDCRWLDANFITTGDGVVYCFFPLAKILMD